MRPGSGLAAAMVCVGLAAPAAAQRGVGPASDQSWCGEDRHDRSWARHCEVREATWPAGSGPIAVDAAPNGGIQVVGWDRKEVRLLVKVVASAETEAEARDLAGQVQIVTDGTIRAEGARDRRGKRGFSVSYRLEVPRRSDLKLESSNGGIKVQGVTGDLSLETKNGGLHLDGLAGDVRGRTTNGGVHVNLSGQSWDGTGLDVATTNGGIHLGVPDGYNARLETGTVNGRIHLGFPVSVQGQIERRLSTDLGRGGRPIRVVTTNGGVHLERR